MTSLMTQAFAAILMVAAAVAMVAWFLRSEDAASARRMMAMIRRVGLDPRLASSDDPTLQAIIDDTRRRCRKCMQEDVCKRWLAGKARGGNDFCPNAPVFQDLAESGRRAA